MKNIGTLREKVYKYLRRELARGNLRYESFIDQNKICEHLGVSRAPLRDALIQLEAERFVKILPRRGVRINKLSMEDIRNSYDVLAAVDRPLPAGPFLLAGYRHDPFQSRRWAANLNFFEGRVQW